MSSLLCVEILAFNLANLLSEKRRPDFLSFDFSIEYCLHLYLTYSHLTIGSEGSGTFPAKGGISFF